MIRLHYVIKTGIRKIQWTCQKMFTKDHLSSPEVFNAGSYIARYAYPRIKKMRANYQDSLAHLSRNNNG